MLKRIFRDIMYKNKCLIKKEEKMNRFGNLPLKEEYFSPWVKSHYGYPSDFKPRHIIDQINLLAKYFNFDPKNALAMAKDFPSLGSFVPADFIKDVSLHAFVKRSSLSMDIADPSLSYCESTKKIYDKLAQTRGTIYFPEEIVPEKFKQNQRTKSCLDLIEEKQPGNILIIAAQHGICRRGESANFGSEEYFQNEFGLDAMALGCMALTNPLRYSVFNELGSIGTGSEYSPKGDGSFTNVITLTSLHDIGNESRFIELNSRNKHQGCAYGGLVTGFVPDLF